MTKRQQITELKRMVNRTIRGFKGTDKTTIAVNKKLGYAYHELCEAYNLSHGWLIKKK